MSGRSAFRITSCKQLGTHFKYCQAMKHVRKAHFQTACESHDLDMNFVHLTMASNSHAHIEDPT